MSELIKVPDIGGEGEVIEILVQVGDRIEVEQSLVTLESDKASMEVPSPKAGTITAIKVNIGDTLKEGDDLIELEVEGADAAAEQPAEPAEAEEPAEEKPQAAPAAAEKPAAKKAESSVQSFNIPDIGDGSARVIELLVQVGDKVEADQSLLTLESDKASMEIPAPAAGVIEAIEVKLEQEVSTGDLMLRMRVEGEAEEDESAPAAIVEEAQDDVAVTPAKEERPSAPTAEQSAPTPVGAPSRGGKKVHAGPAVRKLAREFGVDLSEITGSGPRNRILKDDVQAHVKAVMQQRKDGGAAATGGAGIP